MNLANMERGGWKVPANATHEIFEEANAIAFFCPVGPVVKVRVYTGRSQKARSQFTARDVESAHSAVLTSVVPRLLRERQARSAAMRKISAKRANLSHSFSVGQILYTSWGYDQTNIDFFEVSRVVSPQSIEVRRRNSAETESSPGAFRGTTVPAEGFADKKTHRLVIGQHGGFSVRAGFGRAQLLYPWDGTPKQYTA